MKQVNIKRPQSGTQIPHVASTWGKPLPVSSSHPSASEGCDGGMFCLCELKGVIIFRNLFSFGFINNPGVEYHQHQKKHPQKLLTHVPYDQGLFPVSAPCQIGHVGNPILSGVEPFYTLLFIPPALMSQIKISKMSFLKNLGNHL